LRGERSARAAVSWQAQGVRAESGCRGTRGRQTAALRDAGSTQDWPGHRDGREETHRFRNEMKLGLGTVQFGLAYGVSNQAGQTPVGEVREILTVARTAGVDLLDTAPSYGVAEQVLGEALAGDRYFRVVTKTPPLEDCASSVAA